jgi:hypothetical protein
VEKTDQASDPRLDSLSASARTQFSLDRRRLDRLLRFIAQTRGQIRNLGAAVQGRDQPGSPGIQIQVAVIPGGHLGMSCLHQSADKTADPGSVRKRLFQPPGTKPSGDRPAGEEPEELGE